MIKIDTKEKILKHSKSLFLSKGFNATTVDDICKDVGITKGGFYHHFKSKEDLGLEVLRKYYFKHMDMLLKSDYQNIKDPIKRVFGFVQHTEKLSLDIWQEGCLFSCYLNDLSESSPKIKKEIEKLFDDWVLRLIDIFKPLAKGNNNITAKELADNYLATIEGFIVLARAYNDPNRIKEGLKLFRKNLKILVD